MVPSIYMNINRSAYFWSYHLQQLNFFWDAIIAQLYILQPRLPFFFNRRFSIDKSGIKNRLPKLFVPGPQRIHLNAIDRVNVVIHICEILLGNNRAIFICLFLNKVAMLTFEMLNYSFDPLTNIFVLQFHSKWWINYIYR